MYYNQHLPGVRDAPPNFRPDASKRSRPDGTTVGYMLNGYQAPPPARTKTFSEFLGEMRTAGAKAYDLIEHTAEGAVGGAMLGKKVAGTRGGVIGGVLGGLAGGFFGPEAAQHIASMDSLGNQYGQVVQVSRHHIDAAQSFLDQHGITTNPSEYGKPSSEGAEDPTR